MLQSKWKALLVAFPITTFCLGVWQVYRLQWKLDLIEHRTSRLNSASVPLAKSLSAEELDELEFRPVTIAGNYLNEEELYVSPRWGTSPGNDDIEVGYHIVTPFQLEQGEKILVNRGWVPTRMKPRTTRPETLIEGDTSLTAIVRRGDKTKHSTFSLDNNPEKNDWHWMDLEAIGKVRDVKPMIVDAVADGPSGFPVGGHTPIHLRNEHKNYAITWFSLSALSTVLLAAALFRKPSKQAQLLSQVRRGL
eukprot:TRINITY_DN11308_c0_g1_i1.p1 TRINITY_DN11308_c0_g1~~TRINITY_DN11308_c0_g1_i1.p1  ORF type:complete len:249 (-),score=47.59 TRINITY_DN11308_c0_g1_i1:128-874(-)